MFYVLEGEGSVAVMCTAQRLYERDIKACFDLDSLSLKGFLDSRTPVWGGACVIRYSANSCTWKKSGECVQQRTLWRCGAVLFKLCWHCHQPDAAAASGSDRFHSPQNKLEQKQRIPHCATTLTPASTNCVFYFCAGVIALLALWTLESLTWSRNEINKTEPTMHLEDCEFWEGTGVVTNHLPVSLYLPAYDASQPDLCH